MERPYVLTPLPIVGAEVTGVDLKQQQPTEIVSLIREDVTRHRLLVFRDQGIVSGERQVQISNWFGELESTFYKHPRSPHPDVFRVSNDRSEGCTGVGCTGWHIDGSFQTAPFAYALYHIWRCPTQGDTVFAPLHDIVSSLPAEQRARWDRLWMLSDRRHREAKPLLYVHPLTGQDAMCFHLGMTDAFVWDYGTPRERVTSGTETQAILDEMEAVFAGSAKHLLYAHKWRPGDFIISDNLALGHEASPETQLPREQVGLRIMHRTTIKGQHVPCKRHAQLAQHAGDQAQHQPQQEDGAD